MKIKKENLRGLEERETMRVSKKKTIERNIDVGKMRIIIVEGKLEDYRRRTKIE